MKTYDFSLTFKIQDELWDVEEITNRLFEAGCDDALVCTGVRNTVLLEFDRESTSANDAIKSAEKDILKAFPQAVIFEAKPDRVSLEDIAKYTGKTRQNVRKLQNFPEPVSTSPNPFWHLFQVIVWYRENKKETFDKSIFEVSKAAWIYNQDIDKKRFKRYQSVEI